MSSSAPDPQRVLRAAGKAIAKAADPVAEHLARTVREMPPERLDWLMRTPSVRRVVLEAVFWQIPVHLDRRRAAGVNASIRWRITGRSDGEVDVYDLIIADGRARVMREHDEPGRRKPRLTVTVDAAEFLRIAAGNSNPVTAYFAGKLSLRGDFMQAARLAMLFRTPSPERKPPRSSGRSDPNASDVS